MTLLLTIKTFLPFKLLKLLGLGVVFMVCCGAVVSPLRKGFSSVSCFHWLFQ